jgi:hypothetical protein
MAYLYLTSVDLPLSFSFVTILLGILYLINPHTSDGQQKELCRHRQC